MIVIKMRSNMMSPMVEWPPPNLQLLISVPPAGQSYSLSPVNISCSNSKIYSESNHNKGNKTIQSFVQDCALPISVSQPNSGCSIHLVQLILPEEVKRIFYCKNPTLQIYIFVFFMLLRSRTDLGTLVFVP